MAKVGIVISAVLFGFFLIGVIITFIKMYNRLISIKEEYTKAWANIDVILKQRYDEIPKLIEVCNQYIKHEVAVIDRIMDARQKMVAGEDKESKMEASNEISASIKGLLAIGEAYPEIKSNENFMQIQSKISELEESLANRREYYNSTITNYNVCIQQIPYNFIAGNLGYLKEPLFEIQDHEKEYPNLKIDILKSH